MVFVFVSEAVQKSKAVQKSLQITIGQVSKAVCCWILFPCLYFHLVTQPMKAYIYKASSGITSFRQKHRVVSCNQYRTKARLSPNGAIARRLQEDQRCKLRRGATPGLHWRVRAHTHRRHFCKRAHAPRYVRGNVEGNAFARRARCKASAETQAPRP